MCQRATGVSRHEQYADLGSHRARSVDEVEHRRRILRELEGVLGPARHADVVPGLPPRASRDRSDRLVVVDQQHGLRAVTRASRPVECDKFTPIATP
jgi:hypothetical protein